MWRPNRVFGVNECCEQAIAAQLENQICPRRRIVERIGADEPRKFCRAKDHFCRKIRRGWEARLDKWGKGGAAIVLDHDAVRRDHVPVVDHPG